MSPPGGPNPATALTDMAWMSTIPKKIRARLATRPTVYLLCVVKIKLKIRESGNEIKLGIYDKPLAAQLNQARREEAPSDLYQQAPAKGRSGKSAPLW